LDLVVGVSTIYDLYSDGTLDVVREQLASVADLDFYQEFYERAGIDPGDIESWETFAELPFTDTEELLLDTDENPPEGSLYREESMLSFTPAKNSRLPIWETPIDHDRYSEYHETAYERIGLESGMRAVNTFGYHHIGSGYTLHQSLEEFGIEVYPAGPGNAARTAEIIDEFDIEIFIGNPSFALEIASEGGTAIDFVIGGGEPFSSIPGQREKVYEAFDALQAAIDVFGLRQALLVAAECAAEDGLHVIDDAMLVEIIDPDTGELLEPGERGELVLTHLEREAQPLVRYRTGDLSLIEEADCSHCEASITMPNGVFGRTDKRLKVKGVKMYPEGVFLTLIGFPNLTGNHQIRVSRPDNTDRLTVIVEGEAKEAALGEALSEQLLITPDEIQFVDDLEEGPNVIDERH
jgi:phenylacetate-CoA ligase